MSAPWVTDTATLARMATLRLFANLRESAGTTTADFEAATVGDLLSQASDRFGDQFRSGLGAARVWVNGEQAEATTPLVATDEVALIPPVSGGAVATRSVEVPPNLLSVALIVSLLAVAWAPLEWFVLVAVGAVLAWVWDVSDTAKLVGTGFVPFPPLISATITGASTYAWGFNGFAAAIALSVIIAVSWPVFDKNAREFRITANTTLITLVAGSASAGLILIRLLGPYAVVTFVLITIFALIGAWIAGSFGSQIQSIDANVGALLGALVAGLVVGLSIDELDIAAGLLGGVAIAAGVIAGRALGSMVRTGTVTHTEDPPGELSMFDGAIVAAPLFWLVLWLFA